MFLSIMLMYMLKFCSVLINFCLFFMSIYSGFLMYCLMSLDGSISDGFVFVVLVGSVIV